MFHYLDNAATTPVRPEAAQAALEAMTEGWGNPSSQYVLGRQAADRVKGWRGELAKALGCGPEELCFTSCGSESDNWAILGALEINRRKGRHIVTTAVEHAAVLEPLKALERQGYEVTYLQPDHAGHIDPAQVTGALRPDTALVSMMLVNNELGTVLPVKETARALRGAGSSALLHCDAVQGFLKVPFTPAELGVDLLSVSGHKVHAPKGIGAIWIKKGVRVRPLWYGSGQEGGLHPGTENTPGACAFATAARELWEKRDENMAHYQALRDRLLCGLEKIPGACINSGRYSAPYIVNFSLPGIRSEVMIHYLEQQGISVSSGSACSKGAKSHVLTAMGLDPRRVDSAIRVSFCRDNTAEEVDTLCHWLAQGCGQLAKVRR